MWNLFVEPVFGGKDLRDVVAKQFESVARKGAEKFATEVVGKVAQNEVAIAFDGNAAQTPSAVGRKVDTPKLALVDEVVDVPLRAPELRRHFAYRQRRAVDEIHRPKREFKLSVLGHRGKISPRLVCIDVVADFARLVFEEFVVAATECF